MKALKSFLLKKAFEGFYQFKLLRASTKASFLGLLSFEDFCEIYNMKFYN